ncbi:MAG: UDP-N-acetylmuramate:L-alanyl-gamma-D-glutamyl-meso-diaminopimelate ligase [Calditrichia bacterium]
MNFYFLGICGTAMASLAILLKQKGHNVWGSDQNIYPPMSDFLKQHQIPVAEGYDISHLDRPFDTAIIGNALSRGNPEVEALLSRRLPFVSLPEMIRREFASQKQSIVITGTHGKTTTTALMSWLLENAGLDPTFLIGGISRNFETSARIGNGDYFVVEGDEYDSAFFDKRPKFLHYFPRYLIINNIEFDHADIYRNLDEIKDSFRKLLRLVPQDGLIAANGDDLAVREVLTEARTPVAYYGARAENDWFFRQKEVSAEGTRFTLHRNGKVWNEFMLPLFGEYQLYNAAAVIAVAHELGISPEKTGEGLRSFLNVKRRLEPWGTLNGAPFFDDFAHHPTAIRKTLQALQDRFPARRRVALFEARTNTTVTNIFQSELGEALAHAQIVIMPPIHRAGNIPPENRLDPEHLQRELHQKGCRVVLLPDYESIPDVLRQTVEAEDVVVLMSNGSLGGHYESLRDLIQQAK